MSHEADASVGAPREEAQLTLEQALARIAELEQEVEEVRERGRSVAEFYLTDVLDSATPLEIVELVTRLMRRYLTDAKLATEESSVWVFVERNRFAIGPGALLGKPDPEALNAAQEHFANSIAPQIVRNAEGTPYLALPLFTAYNPADIFGVIAVELTSEELEPDVATISLSIALSATLHLDRTSRVAEAMRSTQYAQAAARAQMLLAGPCERDEALRLVVEALEICDDVTGAAAVITAADPPTTLVAWGDVDASQAATLAREVSSAQADGLRTLPVRIDDSVEAVIVLNTRSVLKALENEMLGTMTSAVGGAVARYRAGLTIESLRRSATRRLVEAQERERSMIAADIHDGVLQQLGATAIRLELAQARAQQGDLDTALEIIEDGAKEIRSCARELRALLMELRPQVLDDNGLSAAIKELGRNVKDVDVRVSTDVPDDLGPEYSITIFRIVQEALTNIEKHAHAKHADVNVRLEHGAVDIEVRDDGIGYEAAVTGPSSEGSHLGLLGMRERARMLNGRFSIEGGPGRGTLLRAILPVATHGDRLPEREPVSGAGDS